MKLICFSFILLAALLPAQAFAHALEGRVLALDKAVVAEFVYSSGNAARFIKAEVYSPADQKIEFQTGRTDMKGRVVFIPDVPGSWLIVVADNQGHRAELAVDVSAMPEPVSADPASPGSPVSATASSALPASVAEDNGGIDQGAGKGFKLILGLSLILNLTLAAVLFTRRKKS